jgi:hypothetical protein
MDEAEADGLLIDLFQTDEVGSFTRPVVIEDDIEFGFETLKGVVLGWCLQRGSCPWIPGSTGCSSKARILSTYRYFHG